ncbi:MAG: hypothetical protein AMXMBFR64_45080 [Myxococcales bacterium]
MRKLRTSAILGSIVAALLLGATGCKKEQPAAPAPPAGAAKPAEAPKPAEAAPKEAPPAEAKPAEAPMEAKPVEAVEAAPTEAKPAEAAPTTAPTEAAAEPANEQAAAENAQQKRQQRLQDIYTLGRTGDDASVDELIKIMKSEEEPGIRATAIRVMGREKIDRVVPELEELAKSTIPPVKIEAAILLYQWGDKEKAMPILKELSTQGVALRRAFLTGRKDGKNQYDENAKSFLESGLKAENVYTKLDAALGLYEMGNAKKSLDVFREVMEKEETFYVRMAALNYLRHLKDDPPIRKIIEAAKNDADERVKQRAEQILSEGQAQPPAVP